MNQDRRRPYYALSAALLVVGVAVAAVVTGARLFPVMVFALAALAFLACWLTSGLKQNLCLTLGAMLVVLAGTDVVIRRLTPNFPIDKVHSGEGHSTDFNVARAAPISYSVLGRLVSNGDRIYNVTYTLDTHGHRLTPGGGPDADTYLFFGDSYTYGEGVEDDQAIPAQFSKAMGYRYTVANLGFHGLGPQHMLRLLEAGDVDPLVTGKVRRSYYSIIDDHLSRVLARRVSLLPGPRYVLGSDGRPAYMGRFIDSIWGRLAQWAEDTGGLPARSRALSMTLLYPTSYRIDLTLAILKESARLLADKFGTELVVLVFDRTDEDRQLGAAIQQTGLKTIFVSSVIGDLNTPENQLKPGVDRHPTARAAARLAAALAAMETTAASAPSAAAE